MDNYELDLGNDEVENSLRVRFDVSEREVPGPSSTLHEASDNLGRGYKSENDIDGKASRKISFKLDGSTPRRSNDNYSQRSRASTVSQVRWKPILDEIANDSNGSDIDQELNSMNRLVSLIEELSKNKDYSKEGFERICNLVNDVADETADEKRKYKKRITKLGNQVERLKEKVEVNILLDSRVKDQKERLEELERENRILRGLRESEDEDSSQIRAMLQHDYNPFHNEVDRNKERPGRVTRRRQNRARAKEDGIKAVNSPISSLTMETEMSSMFVQVLRENNENYRRTNDQLIKVNENLLDRNQKLVAELDSTRGTFRDEQKQWQKNWEKLKEHYEMQFKILNTNSKTKSEKP